MIDLWASPLDYADLSFVIHHFADFDFVSYWKSA